MFLLKKLYVHTYYYNCNAFFVFKKNLGASRATFHALNESLLGWCLDMMVLSKIYEM